MSTTGLARTRAVALFSLLTLECSRQPQSLRADGGFAVVPTATMTTLFAQGPLIGSLPPDVTLTLEDGFRLSLSAERAAGHGQRRIALGLAADVSL